MPAISALLSKFNSNSLSNISSSDKSDFQPYAAKTDPSNRWCAKSNQVGGWFFFWLAPPVII
jgi:hypothetical protein